MTEPSSLEQHFSRILQITNQMFHALHDQNNLSHFYTLFEERSMCFKDIDTTSQITDEAVRKIVEEILKLDHLIQEALKLVQKEAAYQQIKIVHALHSLDTMDFASYIDTKK